MINERPEMKLFRSKTEIRLETLRLEMQAELKAVREALLRVEQVADVRLRRLEERAK